MKIPSWIPESFSSYHPVFHTIEDLKRGHPQAPKVQGSIGWALVDGEHYPYQHDGVMWKLMRAEAHSESHSDHPHNPQVLRMWTTGTTGS